MTMSEPHDPMVRYPDYDEDEIYVEDDGTEQPERPCNPKDLPRLMALREELVRAGRLKPLSEERLRQLQEQLQQWQQQQQPGEQKGDGKTDAT
jgi:hypothetical protein